MHLKDEESSIKRWGFLLLNWLAGGESLVISNSNTVQTGENVGKIILCVRVFYLFIFCCCFFKEIVQEDHFTKMVCYL